MSEQQEKVTLGSLIGEGFSDQFEDFDMTEIQEVLSNLAMVDAIDFSHAEYLQQRALYGANIVLDYMARLVKIVSYLESKINSVKNKYALAYKAPDGERTTADMKKQAGESAPEVDAYTERLARAKGAKLSLERKYEILIKSHHHFKEIAIGHKRTIPGYTSKTSSVEGWE